MTRSAATPASASARRTSRFFSSVVSEVYPVSTRTRGAKRGLSITLNQEKPTIVTAIKDEKPSTVVAAAIKARDTAVLMSAVKQEAKNTSNRATITFPKKRSAASIASKDDSAKSNKVPKTKMNAESIKLKSKLESESIKPISKIKSESKSKLKSAPEPKLTKTETKTEADKAKPKPKSKSTKAKTRLTKAERLATFKSKPTVKGPFKEPLGWVGIWDTMTHLRAARNAPVDDMVPDADVVTKENSKWKYTRDDKNYHDLISLMLSSQTKDTINITTMLKLREFGLTVDRVLATDDEDLKALINKVGFYNRKTIYIKQATTIIKNEHNGLVPETLEALLKLPGVGPKMAYLVLSHSFNKHLGIGVDTHVHRISNELEWARGSTPEGTRKHLQSWLPQDRWFLINFLMVGIGQQIQQPLERPKVLKQCLSHPKIDAQCAGLRLLEKLGLKVEAEAVKGEFELPHNWNITTKE